MNREYVRAAGLGGDQTRDRVHGDTGDVVIGVGDRDICPITSRVAGVAADGQGHHDRVSHRAVDAEIILARDRDGPRDTPVRGRERQ